jgi:hypothetical protein
LANKSSGIVRFEVAGKQIERLAVPTEVLHDLRGQLDEIPGDIRAGEGFHGDFAEQAVEQVAEFVENRFHLAVC